MTLNILLSFAQFEREIIGERIRDKIAAAKKKGKYVGGRPLLGYDVDKEAMRMVINEQEARLVRHIFDRFVRIGSCMKVAQELNASGYRMKSWTSRKGKPQGGNSWDKSYVHNVLTNRRYLGEVMHLGKSYPGEHEAIIDRPTWEKAHSILATNRAYRGNQTRRKTIAVLKGLVRCGHCGGAMHDTYTKRHGKQYRYYVCNKATKVGMEACPIRSVPAGQVEDAVLKYLQSVFRSPEVVAKTIRQMQSQAAQQRRDVERQQQALDQRMTVLKKSIRRLLDADGAADGGALADELRRLNKEDAEVHRQHADLDARAAAVSDLPEEAQVIAALRSMDPLWDELFPAEKHRIAQLLVEQVVVETDALTVRLRAQGLRDVIDDLHRSADAATIRKENA